MDKAPKQNVCFTKTAGFVQNRAEHRKRIRNVFNIHNEKKRPLNRDTVHIFMQNAPPYAANDLYSDAGNRCLCAQMYI